MITLLVFCQNTVCTDWLICHSVQKYYSIFRNKNDVLPIITRLDSKPMITNLDINISVSHSDNLCVCAVSNGKVGVDIEKHRHRNDFSAISKRFFEKQTESIQEFYDLWTAKESYKKFSDVNLLSALKDTPYQLVTNLAIIDGFSTAVCQGHRNDSLYVIFQ